MAKHRVKFKNWNCIVEKKSYYNGRIALVLTEESTAEPIATATINIDDYIMSEGKEKQYTFIKDYSENEGMLEALIHAGIVEFTGILWPIGFVSAALVKVLI